MTGGAASAEAPLAGAASAGGSRTALSVARLKAYYRTRHFGISRDVAAVDDVSFGVARNEIYGLAGESSSGKTTLIKAIAGLVRPPLEIVAGSVNFNFLPAYAGLHLAPAEEVERIRWRNLSYIMQGSMSVLNPVRRIRESFRDFAFSHMGLARRAFEAEVEAHLARVRLDASVLSAYPHELSGGMRQRVTIALATICKPDFIIADEPTTALDVIVQKDVLDMLRRVQREMGSSVLFVTHDMGVHAYLTDRLAIMYAGRLVEEGSTADIFTSPLHPYTRHLVASLPRIGDDAPRKGLEGRPPNLSEPPQGCRFHPRCPLAMEVCRTQAPPMRDHGAGRRVACFAVEDAGGGT